MALQGKFYANHDMTGAALFQEFPDAYYKVVRASLAAVDYEVWSPGADAATGWTTRYAGQGIVAVWVDKGAYDNRATPLAVFPLEFEANATDTAQSLLTQAYNALSAQRAEDNLVQV